MKTLQRIASTLWMAGFALVIGCGPGMDENGNLVTYCDSESCLESIALHQAPRYLDDPTEVDTQNQDLLVNLDAETQIPGDVIAKAGFQEEGFEDTLREEEGEEEEGIDTEDEEEETEPGFKQPTTGPDPYIIDFPQGETSEPSNEKIRSLLKKVRVVEE